MEVHFTPDQQAFVRQVVESGRFAKEADVVTEALQLLEDREFRRAQILTAVDDAEASLARGEGLPVNRDSVRQVVEDVKARGRARLAAEGTVLR